MNLNLKDFGKSNLKDMEFSHKLIAAINYISNIEKGHYIANLKIGFLWHEFNDSFV